jgi:hypothetical protein
MRGRLTILAGALAVVAATGLAVATGLGAFDSGPAGPAQRTTYVVGRSAKGQQGDPTPAPRSTPSVPHRFAPAPALVSEPARGPAFAIARLRPGSRVGMWRAPGGRFVETLGPRTEFGSPIVLSVVRSRGGWLGVSTPDLPDGRLGWIRYDPHRVEVYWTKYSLHANLSARRLTLRYGDGTVARFVVTVGGPGTETPAGRFGITDAVHFDESPFYGCCALALSGNQTKLPSDWTGGDRIAIHGTPGPVGGAESNGCIRATDSTMRTLFRRVPLGTPVFVRE